MLQTSCTNSDKQKKHLNISFSSEPFTKDPRKSGDFSTSAISFLLFSGLTETTPSGNIEKALAEKIEISKDKKTYTFFLKEAKWSDGTPITAYDFEYSWKKVIDPNFSSLCPHLFYPIKNVEKIISKKLPIAEAGFYAINDKTFIVELENPNPNFLSLISFCVFFPIPKHIEISDPNWSQNISKPFVSSGPFLLEKWGQNSKIQLRANPYFYNAKAMDIHSLTVHIIPDANTALNMFYQNELDWQGSFISPLPEDSYESLIKQNLLKTKNLAGLTFCTYNLNKYPFHNANLRKAFSSAVNKEEIIKNISPLNEDIANQFIPSAFEDYPQTSTLQYDLDKAKKYFELALNELGINKDDLELKFSYCAKEKLKRVSLILKEQWEKAFNISIELQQQETTTGISNFHKKNYQFGLCYLVAQYNDPLNVFDRFKYPENPKNYPGWNNINYQNFLNEAIETPSQKKRNQLLKQAEMILLEELPITPLYFHKIGFIAQKHNYDNFIGPLGDLHFEKIKIKGSK
ncbi:MAG TPA: peptide ABC transporter substrate-binding protein [Chlamydiales bacterium]|nr:peptide ABC transporter substrate-binding protein [Chlamydiales bacterium]